MIRCVFVIRARLLECALCLFFPTLFSFILITADQEVINFLDGRVVELEKQQLAQAEAAEVARIQSANREAAALQQVRLMS